MIYLLRHGETIWNTEQRKQGHKNSPLTENGITQARAAGNYLSKELASTSFALYTSPLGRAMDTVAIISESFERKLKIYENENLKECCFGVWEGHTEDEIEKSYPGQISTRMQDKWSYVITGGESYQNLYERVIPFFEEIREKNSGKTTVIVTHEMVSNVIRGYLQSSLSKKDISNLRHPQNTLYMITNQVKAKIFLR